MKRLLSTCDRQLADDVSVRPFHFSRFKTTEDGYRIRCNNAEWIAYRIIDTHREGYELHGPFKQGEVVSVLQIAYLKPKGCFRNVDECISYIKDSTILRRTGA